MKKLTRILLLILHLCYPLCLGFGLVIRREFILSCDWAFFPVITAVTVFLICIANWKELPAPEITAMVLNGLCTLGCEGWIPKVCAGIWFVCCVIPFVRFVPLKKLIPVLAVLLVLTLVLVYVFNASLMLGDLGMSSSEWQVESPDGRYTILMRTMDYGFAAGITQIYARDNSEALNILIGKFYPPSEHIGATHSFAWFEDISWPDENTMMIGDESYTMP